MYSTELHRQAAFGKVLVGGNPQSPETVQVQSAHSGQSQKKEVSAKVLPLFCLFSELRNFEIL